MSRRTNFVIFFFCIVKLAIHLVADSNSGFQVDELLHIETGNNLAFGVYGVPADDWYVGVFPESVSVG